MFKPKYMVWDKFDNRVHIAPLTKSGALKWMDYARDIMPRAAGVDEVWEIRRYYTNSGNWKFGLGLAIGVVTGVGITVAGVLTDRIVIVKHEEKN